MELLQREVERRPELKAFVVFIGGDAKKIEKLAADHKIERIGVMQVPADDPAVRAHGLGPVGALRNAIFLYKNRRVEKKFLNLKLDASGSKSLRTAIEQLK